MGSPLHRPRLSEVAPRVAAVVQQLRTAGITHPDLLTAALGFLLEKLHQWEVCLIHPRPATYVCSDRWVLLVRCTQGLALVEVDMHQFFEIARPSDEYRTILADLQPIFVGSLASLDKIIDYLCEQISRSFECRGMPVPPWRAASVVRKCFCMMEAPSATHSEDARALFGSLEGALHNPASTQKRKAVPVKFQSLVEALSAVIPTQEDSPPSPPPPPRAEEHKATEATTASTPASLPLSKSSSVFSGLCDVICSSSGEEDEEEEEEEKTSSIPPKNQEDVAAMVDLLQQALTNPMANSSSMPRCLSLSGHPKRIMSSS